MSVDDFAFLVLVGNILPITMQWHLEIFGMQVCVGQCWTPIGSDKKRSVPSPSRHGGIPLRILWILAPFWVCRNTPFWDSNFSPPCGHLAASYLFAHEEPGPKLQVLHLDMSLRTCLLSHEPWGLPLLPRATMGPTSGLPILAIL